MTRGNGLFAASPWRKRGRRDTLESAWGLGPGRVRSSP